MTRNEIESVLEAALKPKLIGQFSPTNRARKIIDVKVSITDESIYTGCNNCDADYYGNCYTEVTKLKIEIKTTTSKGKSDRWEEYSI